MKQFDRPMLRRLRLPACACGAACACAGIASPAQAPAVQPVAHAAATLTISAAANGDTRFSRTKLSASAGRVVLRLKNPSDTDHAIAIGSRKGHEVGRGGVSRISLRLKPGKYTYYCPVDSHRAAGMRGRLTIR